MPATSPLGRPVGASGEATRTRIIHAAMRCVAEMGYSQATIRGIARTAGITSGSLYHYFPNKSELLKSTAAAVDDIAFPRLRAAAAGSRDVVDRLEAVLDESERLMREYPHLADFERAIRAESSPHLRGEEGQQLGFQALRRVIGDIIGDTAARGLLPSCTDPEAAVNAIYALTRGLTEQAADLPRQTHQENLVSAKQLIRGTLFRANPQRVATDVAGSVG